MRGIVFVVLLIIVLLLAMLELSSGSAEMSFLEVLDVIGGRSHDAMNTKIVQEIRMPRMVAAMLSGAGLASSGLMLQTLFRNPLAGPSVLGITSGSSLAIALITMVGGIGIGVVAPPLAAFVGAMLVLLLIILADLRARNSVTLLIVGLMIGYLCSALVSVVEANSAAEGVRRFVIWGMGSFDGVTNSDLLVLAPIVLLSLVTAILMAQNLNGLLLGEEHARSMGLNVNRNKQAVILVTGILASVITAYVGPVAFLGLAVPHVARGMFHTADHRILFPATILLGVAIAFACDIIVHAGFTGTALPLNAVTSLFGAPVVLWIILKGKNWYNLS
jgi:iron complex transport system permease protein